MLAIMLVAHLSVSLYATMNPEQFRSLLIAYSVYKWQQEQWQQASTLGIRVISIGWLSFTAILWFANQDAIMRDGKTMVSFLIKAITEPG